jgi:hypothetical protein
VKNALYKSNQIEGGEPKDTRTRGQELKNLPNSKDKLKIGKSTSVHKHHEYENAQKKHFKYRSTNKDNPSLHI